MLVGEDIAPISAVNTNVCGGPQTCGLSFSFATRYYDDQLNETNRMQPNLGDFKTKVQDA